MNRILIKFGPFTIYYYSVIIILSILIGIYIAKKESTKLNMSTYIENILFDIIIFGIIGARAYYVIFNFSAYKSDILSIFKIWEGGIAIYGGIIGGFVAVVYNAIKQKQSIIQTTDILMPGLILAQSIGRWGNFFNQEAHGGVVTFEYLKSIHIPKFIIDGMNIDGIYYHPTFLYESLWCLLGFAILIMIRHLTKRKQGIVTYTYMIYYGIGRYIIEGIRTDSLYLGIFRVSQIVSIIIIIIGIVGICISIVNKNGINQEKKNRI